VNKPREEIGADGSGRIGKGPTYIVFWEDGNVSLEILAERAEHQALRKNFSPEVTSGGVTLMTNELLFNKEGVPPYSERLASLVQSIVYNERSEQDAKKVLKQFSSIVFAAWRLAREPLGKTAHESFRAIVMHLAKRSGRVPTKSEIRHAMFPEAPPDELNKFTAEITRLCRANGLNWLPIGKPGRKKKTEKIPEKRNKH
jgi:hypothetical protein